MPSERTDDETIRRVQEGDRSAFLTLFDRHYGRIERYSRYQLHNAETARDIASETFLRAYRSIDRFRIGEISFIGYLFVICRRLIQTERQRAGVAQTISLDQCIEESSDSDRRLADPSGQPLARLLRGERREIVQNALKTLAPDDREIILLAFEEELSRKEIAPLLGKPSVTAVTSHLHRAMQKLKAALIKADYFAATHGAE